MNAVEIQDICLLLPNADINAIDDPNDPLQSDDDGGYIHWDDVTSDGLDHPNSEDAVFDDRPVHKWTMLPK
jgi:hypothetical protein